MTPHTARPRRLLAGARRAGRALARLGLAIVALRLGAAAAGTFPAAAAGAVAFTVEAVRWWARVVEGRLLAPQPPRPPATGVQLAAPPAPATLDAQHHVAFAQALTVVAARYLAECEAENRP
jgi:hypothetical protein